MIGDWIRDRWESISQALCPHPASSQVFEVVETTFDGNTHHSEFWQCADCEKVLRVERQWMLPEGEGGQWQL